MRYLIPSLKKQAIIILEGHLLNPFWHSKEERRIKRYRALEKAYMSYLKPYKNFVRELVTQHSNPIPEQDRVFTIWYQGEDNAPEIVKACFRSMRRNLKQELIVLDENTIFDWITLPEHIIDKWNRGLITPTHFSDICRVELLYRHGGIWLDSTCFVTNPIPRELLDMDFFVYMAGVKLQRKFTFIQSCFIRARKEYPLLDIWRRLLYEYWKKEDTLFDYYTLHLLLCFAVRNNLTANSLFRNMPKIDQDPTHRLWYSGYKDTPYSPERFEDATRGTFFQKTSYKDQAAVTPIEGSIAEYIMKY